MIRALWLVLSCLFAIGVQAHTAFLPVSAVEANLISVQHNAYFMTAPDVASGNVSELHIINTSGASQQFYGTLWEKDGSQLGEAETLLTSSSVAPYARVTLTSEKIRDVFGETWSGPAMLEVFGTGSFSLMIKLTSRGGLTTNVNCVSEDVVHNVEGEDSDALMWVRFINTSNTATTAVYGSLYDESGNLVGSENQELHSSLAAKEQKFLNRNELADIFGSWNGDASLYVAETPNLKLLQMIYISSQSTLANFTCFDGYDDAVNPAEDPQATPLTIDIKDQIFSERSADCAVYQNMYLANVTDIQRSLDFEMNVDVTDDGGWCTLSSDGIPNHDFNDQSASFAHDAVEVERTFTIPLMPSVAASSTPLAQDIYNAVMLNGVVLDILSAGCYNPNHMMADADGNTPIGCTTNDDWLIDPLGTESGFGTDMHTAHTQPDGTYHYHGNPEAMFDDNPDSEGSPVIGFAADGFPIYGTYFKDPQTNQVRKAVSGYTLKPGSRGTNSNTNPGGNYDGTYIDDYEFTDAGDLDQCNGMTVDAQYGYYVVESYPWVIKCFSGMPDSSFQKGL